MSDTPSPAGPSGNGAPPRRQWGPYIVLVLLGFAVVVTARTSHPGARAGRARLIDLIAQEDERSRSLRKEVDALQAQLEALERQAASGNTLASLREQVEKLAARAGLEAVRGPGLEVVLRDSTLRRAPSGDPNDLVIHEQDLQAIVNALWSGGAEAMAINRERITSSSAVRCVGNTLLLHGSVYAPPYRIEAIGDPARLQRALSRDSQARHFAALAKDFRLGFAVRPLDTLALPAFSGAI